MRGLPEQTRNGRTYAGNSYQSHLIEEGVNAAIHDTINNLPPVRPSEDRIRPGATAYDDAGLDGEMRVTVVFAGYEREPLSLALTKRVLADTENLLHNDWAIYNFHQMHVQVRDGTQPLMLIKVKTSTGQAVNLATQGAFDIEGRFFPDRKVPIDKVFGVLDKEIGNIAKAYIERGHKEDWDYNSFPDGNGEVQLHELLWAGEFFDTDMSSAYRAIRLWLQNRVDCCFIGTFNLFADIDGIREQIGKIQILDASHDFGRALVDDSLGTNSSHYDSQSRTNGSTFGSSISEV